MSEADKPLGDDDFQNKVYEAISANPALKNLVHTDLVVGIGVGNTEDGKPILSIMVIDDKAELAVKRLLNAQDSFTLDVEGYGKITLPLTYEISGPFVLEAKTPAR